MVQPDPIFLLGVILLSGYFSLILFEKKKVSQIVTLMFLGILLGPVLNIIDVSETSIPYKISPFLATLALILMLFDGGLNLNLLKTMKEFPISFTFTIVLFIFSSLATMFILNLFFSYDLLHSLLIGVILGGTSSAVILTVVDRVNISSYFKTFLSLESTLTDVLVVIVSSIIIALIVEGNVDLSTATILLTSAFSTSIVFGFLVAFFWIHILSSLEDKSLSYMLTIAILMLLYSIANFLGGNGSFAVFVFALVLGNIGMFEKIINVFSKKPIEFDLRLDNRIKTFQEEITFFIRTFFFVYLGMIIPLDSLFTFNHLLISFLLSIVYLLLRVAIVKLIFGNGKKDLLLVSTSLGRGLAAAVVANIAISKGVNIQGFLEIIAGVILFTNIITTIGLYYYEIIKEKENNNKKRKKHVV